MRWRRIAVLSALWCAMAIAPAALGAHLLDTHARGAVIWWVAGIWIVGYLIQLLLFRAISRAARRGTAVGWLLATAVPWLTDWTAPLSPWWTAPAGAILAGYAVWLCWSVYRIDVLRRDGSHAAALVLEVIRPKFNVALKGDRVRRKVRLRVEGLVGAPQLEAALNGAFAVGKLPAPGDRLAIRVDPRRPRHFELIDGEPIERAAVNSPALDPHSADQLRRLTAMHDRGDLTDQEFAAAKKRLLGMARQEHLRGD